MTCLQPDFEYSGFPGSCSFSNLLCSFLFQIVHGCKNLFFQKSVLKAPLSAIQKLHISLWSWFRSVQPVLILKCKTLFFDVFFIPYSVWMQKLVFDQPRTRFTKIMIDKNMLESLWWWWRGGGGRANPSLIQLSETFKQVNLINFLIREALKTLVEDPHWLICPPHNRAE